MAGGPLRIGHRWLVGPAGIAVPPDSGRVALIAPRGAFGSGEHETTASCLEAVEGLAGVAGSRVLDVGCGTGILAVAALELGAAWAVGVDIDPRAAATSHCCARLNGVADRLLVMLGPVHAVAPACFDVVLANLHGEVLLDLAEAIVAAAAPGARLILSGVAWEHAYPVRERYRSLGCDHEAERWLDEFVTMHLSVPCGGPRVQ